MENETKNTEVLHSIASYLRIIAASSVKPRAGQVLDKYEKAMAYSKMDGSTSQMKIATTLGVPQRTIAYWADDFLHYHLVEAPSEYNSSHKALFTLEELGIDITGLKKQYAKPAIPQIDSTKNIQGEINGNQTQ
jgi:hypothetical protein